MKLTQTQAGIVAHRGSSLLVSASAGAGKTEVLAQRCVALVADGEYPCGIEQLLVVTFTRAAAAELRVRVARMLREAAARTPGAELRRHLRRQALLVDGADIGTIDAWCGRLVREHYADAGVDVRFTTLSEEDARLLRAEVLDELFEWVYVAPDALAVEARAWLSLSPVPDDGFLRALVAQLNRFREHLVNPDDWLARQQAACEADDTAAVLAAALAAECRFQEEQLTAMLAGGAEDARAALRPYLDQLGAWLRMLAAPDGLQRLMADLAAYVIPKPRRGTSEPALVSEVRKRWLAQRLQARWSPDEIRPVLQHGPAAARWTQTLLRLEDQYQRLLSAAKRQRAAYEFGDVLRAALDLLGQPDGEGRRVPTDIARRLRERYAHVLVDEFQDTSPVQVELLRLVTRDTPGATNGFMVGDVKQSIYGFREAEPRLFVELADAFDRGQGEGHVEHLSDNFRSHGNLLAALNELFARLFDRRLGGTAYAQPEWLRAGRAGEELPNPTLAGRPRVSVWVLEHDPRHSAADDDDGQDVEQVEREAQLAAERIQQMLREGGQVTERGDDQKLRLRPLRPGDVVVLLRSAVRNAALVARVLRDNGVPCVARGREALLDAVEVRDVCNVLALLGNRQQDVPLAAYLRSPLVGLDEAELLAVRTASAPPSAAYFAAVNQYRHRRPSEALAVKLDAAFGQLDRWARVAREAELPTLLREILRDSGWPFFVAGLRGGAQRVALLEALRSFAAAFAAGGEGTADGFSAYLEELAAEEVAPAAQAPGPEDAVRIMTIHGAKGLEFPVVFLLGAGARFNTRSRARAFQCDGELGIGLRFRDYPARATVRSARHLVITHRVAQRELEEELRLLYVAATRARERLVLVGHTPTGAWAKHLETCAGHAAPPLISRLGATNRLEWALAAAACLPEATRTRLLDLDVRPASAVRVPEPGSAPPAPVCPPWSAADEAWVRRGRELLGAELGSAYADFPAVLSVSALKEHALRAARSERPATLAAPGVTLSAPHFGAADADADGRVLGTACHRFLEHADLSQLRHTSDVEAQAARLVEAARLSAAEAALLPAADVAWFAGTPDGQQLATAAGVRREVPFVYALALDAAGERTIVRGVIDCVYETAEGLVILDYKTDAPRGDADWATRLAGYRVQLQVYALAAAAILARPVARAALVFLRARRIEAVALGEPLRAALLRVRDTLGGPPCGSAEGAGSQDEAA